jgi:hypothetical protein
MKEFTIKEKEVYVGQEKGKFFCGKDYDVEKKIFMKEAKTNVVDWYLKGLKKDKVVLTLVNYKRED